MEKSWLWMILAVSGCQDPGSSSPRVPPSPPIVEERFARPTPWTRVEVPAAPALTQEVRDLGERLYGWNCFPCHGAEGKGDGPAAQRQGLHPRDFTRGLFKLKTSAPGEMPFDDDLYRTIATGIPVAGMPRIAQLEPQDYWALVAHVKSLSAFQKSAGGWENHFETKPPSTRWRPAQTPPADPVRGKTLFETQAQCATCHGAGGKGNGPAAAGLRDALDRPIAVPDLTRGEVSLKGGSEAGDVYRVLTLGMAGTPMPSFVALSEQDRWDLAAYVRSLFEPIAPGERLYLSAGCTACHTIGKGTLVGPDLMDVATRRDLAWLRRWLADPPAMLEGDFNTRFLFRDFSVQMPNLGLRPAEIDSLVDYLRTLKPR